MRSASACQRAPRQPRQLFAEDAQTIKNDESARNLCFPILKHYLPDPGLCLRTDLAFYGAAPSSSSPLQTAELDHEHLLYDAFAQLFKATEKSHGERGQLLADIINNDRIHNGLVSSA